jgi:Flp pilus assembly pilin Flp
MFTKKTAKSQLKAYLRQTRHLNNKGFLREKSFFLNHKSISTLVEVLIILAVITIPLIVIFHGLIASFLTTIWTNATNSVGG